MLRRGRGKPSPVATLRAPIRSGPPPMVNAVAATSSSPSACPAARRSGLGVTSAEGAGSTFWFSLVLGVPDRLAPPLRRLAGRTGVSALVVDDNATNRDILAENLASWGVKATVVSGGMEALAVLRSRTAAREPFELAIIDHQMPQMDGFELAKTPPASTCSWTEGPQRQPAGRDRRGHWRRAHDLHPGPGAGGPCPPGSDGPISRLMIDRRSVTPGCEIGKPLVTTPPVTWERGDDIWHLEVPEGITTSQARRPWCSRPTSSLRPPRSHSSPVPAPCPLCLDASTLSTEHVTGPIAAWVWRPELVRRGATVVLAVRNLDKGRAPSTTSGRRCRTRICGCRSSI